MGDYSFPRSIRIEFLIAPPEDEVLHLLRQDHHQQKSLFEVIE